MKIETKHNVNDKVYVIDGNGLPSNEVIKEVRVSADEKGIEVRYLIGVTPYNETGVFTSLDELEKHIREQVNEQD